MTAARVDAEQIFMRYVAAEYAYLTSKGEPLCWPVTPYWDEGSRVLSIATGLAYPGKADHAKRDPRVALLFSDPTGSGLDPHPQVLVQGKARVLDSDIQANTDRYVSAVRAKFSVARYAINPVTVKLLDFYLPRLWVEIENPEPVFDPRVTDTLPSDEEMPTTQLGPDEVKALLAVAARIPDAVVTTVDRSGRPLPIRTPVLPRSDGSVLLSTPTFSGPAALTFHRHTLGGTRFQAWMARGTVYNERGSSIFVPRRLVGFFGNGFVFPLSVIPRIGGLRKRLRAELERRGHDMPHLRIPG